MGSGCRCLRHRVTADEAIVGMQTNPNDRSSGIRGQLMTEAEPQKNADSRTDFGAANPVTEAMVFSIEKAQHRDFYQFFLFRCQQLRSCYENMARMIRGTAQKSLLMNMAGRKREMEQKLRMSLGMNDAESAEGEESVLSPFVQYMLNCDMKPVNTINEVFIFISKKEQKELELYSRRADFEEDSGIQRLFIEQMHAVREHLRGLEEDFAHVTFVGAL